MKLLDFKLPNCPVCNKEAVLGKTPNTQCLCDYDLKLYKNGYVALVEFIGIDPREITGRRLYVERVYIEKDTNIDLPHHQTYITMVTSIFELFLELLKTSNQTHH